MQPAVRDDLTETMGGSLAVFFGHQKLLIGRIAGNPMDSDLYFEKFLKVSKRRRKPDPMVSE
jgi:hypothetical protein